MSDIFDLLGEDGVVSLSTHTLPLPGLGIIQIIISSLIDLPRVIKINNAVVRSIKIKTIELTMIVKMKIIKTMLPAAHS